MLVLTKNVFGLCLMCITSQLPLCQLPGNGASYVSLVGQHSQVTPPKKYIQDCCRFPIKSTSKSVN